MTEDLHKILKTTKVEKRRDLSSQLKGTYFVGFDEYKGIRGGIPKFEDGFSCVYLLHITFSEDELIGIQSGKKVGMSCNIKDRASTYQKLLKRGTFDFCSFTQMLVQMLIDNPNINIWITFELLDYDDTERVAKRLEPHWKKECKKLGYDLLCK